MNARRDIHTVELHQTRVAEVALLTTAGAVKASIKVDPVGRVGDKDRGAVLVEKVVDHTLLAAAL